MQRDDTDYAREKLYEAVDCLAGSGNLADRLETAADFIILIKDDRHFPKSEAGLRQLAKFRSIKDRLFGDGNSRVKKSSERHEEGTEASTSSRDSGFGLRHYGFNRAVKIGNQPNRFSDSGKPVEPLTLPVRKGFRQPRPLYAARAAARHSA
jgi:hypothetical protein